MKVPSNGTSMALTGMEPAKSRPFSLQVSKFFGDSDGISEANIRN